MTRVLVVEDSRTQAQELALMLESKGFHVDVSRDGPTGLEQCEREPYDVVLSDVVMPGFDGYEMCRRIKAGAATMHLPVILLTSLADPMDIVRGLECGADNFITKPYDTDYLVGRIEQLLANRLGRNERRLSMGVEMVLMGRRIVINPEKQQMADLLISTFEEVLRSRQREYEARLAEESHARSHRLLQSALDALSSQIAILEVNGEIVAVNASWRKMADDCRWTWPSSAVGCRYDEVFAIGYSASPENARTVLDGVAVVRSGAQESFQFEYPAHKGGEQRWFAMSASRFEGHGPALIAVEHDDITERRRAAEEAAQSEIALRRVEQQLAHSQKMEAIGQLAGGVAHDFNNLLVVISSYAELLRQDVEPDSPMAMDLEQIAGAAERASSLTRQLLAFGRRNVVRRTVLEINDVLTRLEKMLTRIIGEDVELQMSYARELPRVKGDAGQVEQVVMNLAVNARDAMPRGGRLSIETTALELDDATASGLGVKPGAYVRISVRDNGGGMTREVQARIFEPFFTTKPVGKGTGLGLSTVYGIVQQWGGHLAVDSELGRGTSFHVFLPVSTDEKEDAQQIASAGTHRGSETILVLEDDDAVRRVTVRVLRAHGYAVHEAATPSAAREILGLHGAKIDLMLCDVVMPEERGTDFAAAARRTQPSLRVLFMSGYAGTSSTDEIAVPSASSFLDKPFTPDGLAAKLREVLDRPRETP